MPNEIELKLSISSAHLPKLRHHPAILAALTGKPVTRKLTSIYYDTPLLALLDAGISLRVRRMSGGWFQAVKAAGHSLAGLHQRMEWEDIIAFGHPDFSKITEPALIKIFDDPALRAALAPIFTTEVHRTEWHLAWENGDQVELALDLGDLIIGTGDHAKALESISEIELELKGGNTGRLFDLALELQRDIPLQLENISKAQRGYAHYRPQPPAIVKAQKTHLQRHIRAHEAFRQIAWECLGQLQANQEMVLHGTDIEGLHQMRVALRRLRSAISVFGEIIAQDTAAPLRDELRWLSNTLGLARDLDIFVAETLPPILQRLQDHHGLVQLRTKAESVRKSAYKDVRDLLRSQRYHRLLLELGAWLENGRWHRADTSDFSAFDLSKRMLAKRHRQLRKHGSKLAEMHPEERHATRIAAKKLRYTAEFFSSFYPELKYRAFLRSLAKIQDTLGYLNDISVTEHLIRKLTGTRPSSELDESLLLLSGWNACNATHQLLSLGKVWRSFARNTPFWK